MEGAVTGIVSPPVSALPLITLGMLWVILWQGRLRIAGVVPVVLALWLWSDAPRPALLVARDGSLIGAMGPQGRVLSQDRGAGFAARSWLENDGDLVTADVAAARAGFTGPPTARQITLGSVRIMALTGKAGLAQLDSACAMADIVFLAAPLPESPLGCRVFDQTLLARTGPLAFWPEGEGLRVEPTETASRLWSRPSNLEPLPQPALAMVLPKQRLHLAERQE
jgi:competence protein ComEC